MRARRHTRGPAAPRPHGQLRQSQLITTFGPGALLDLPEHAVLVAGLEYWGQPEQDGFRPIGEERLLGKLRDSLALGSLKLYAPPVELGDRATAGPGITVWQFPQWFVAQYTVARRDGSRARPLVHLRQLEQHRYLAADRKPHKVQAMRFVQACPNGHISDIDWYTFAHGGPTDCRQPLWLVERGTSGDFADLFVECECRRQPARSFVEALRSGEQDPALGFCQGHRPWLGPAGREQCDGSPEGFRLPNKLLIRSASNAYFPLTVSVISIPDADEQLRRAVEAVWGDLEWVEDEHDLKRERRKPKIANHLDGFTDEIVLQEIDRRKQGLPARPKSIKQAELELLLAATAELGQDEPEGDFHARALALPPVPAGALARVQRVVLVHRLREVIAQVGFTRFEPPVTDIDGELSLDVRRASLALEVSWLPAIENRGEGIFLAFRPELIQDWLARAAVQERVAMLLHGFDAWQQRHPRTPAHFPGGAYILLHSLAHLLITVVALECGYSASSIRERVYATEGGYGILLYTGTPDAEGTLGGLVQVGHRIAGVLEHALELGRLCSNDPVCGQHRPDEVHEERFLHGAACHGCLLIAETSCERRNEYLDRALVVPTVGAWGAEFFTE